MTRLPAPKRGQEVTWVRTHLGDLAAEPAGQIVASPAFRGGQSAADAALAALDVAGYARDRGEVWPAGRRGASRLSPYIRHGLLPLHRVWDHVATGPSRDVSKFRDELLWQEYARHVYARLGRGTGAPLRHLPPQPPLTSSSSPWDRSMACVDLAVGELERDGWLVNQARMWLASQWTVRGGWDWRTGEEAFFAHLLDGSRAANRLGWQWTVGTGTGRPYGFSRGQVRRRAPGLCETCGLRAACPIEDWPDGAPGPTIDPDPRLRTDPDAQATAGPSSARRLREPEVVWLTAESLGAGDPASRSNPDLPVVFVFDEQLLARVRLSGKRLVFLTQTLAELAESRLLQVHRGDPVSVLDRRAVAVTFAPVPGFVRRAALLEPAELHPYPWLVRPLDTPIASFSSWRRAMGV
jgi:deoxyribodipyrimidine photo-lyase